MTDNNGNHIDMDALMGRIQKLLALADPNANDSAAQIEAAMAKVQELLQKYDMTLEQVQAFQANEADSGITENRVSVYRTKDVLRKHILVKEKYTEWFSDLASAVSASTNTRPLVGTMSAVFIGFKRDVEIASFLFSSLFNRLVEAGVAATAQYTKAYSLKYHKNAMLDWGENHPWNWRQAWFEGAVSALSSRLYSSIKTSQQQQTVEKSQALVVLGNAVDDYLKTTRPKLKSLNDNQIKSSHGALAAYQAGYKAGSEMPLQAGLNSPAANPSIR